MAKKFFFKGIYPTKEQAWQTGKTQKKKNGGHYIIIKSKMNKGWVLFLTRNYY